MTTTNRMRAGTVYGCAFSACNWPESECSGNCSLHRIDAAQIKDDRAVMVAGPVDSPSSSTLPTATELAAPEPLDFASFRPLVAAGLVVLIAALFAWWLS